MSSVTRLGRWLQPTPPVRHRGQPLFVRPAGLPVLWIAAMLLLSSCGMFSKTVAPEEPEARHAVLDTPALRADIYGAMARMNRAQAEGNTEEAEAALDEAMEGLRLLYQRTDGLSDAQGRELYRSVVTAYEQYYGVSDTLSLEYGDIFDFRDEMFAEMNEVREPLTEPQELPVLEPVRTTVPLERNHLVEQSIQYLLRSPERHLYRWMSRSATYFPLFEQVLREEGLPDELKYLSMIESALVPKANSHAGAAGLWQFMPATGREYGLHRTHWVDERLDPDKSTRAAAKYLKKLHRQFDDWYLALAAYNSGPGRVSRAVRRHGQGSSFWDIYDDLPRETRNYVPMFIATATILTSPQAFNLPRVEPGLSYEFDVATVEGMVDLRTAADLAGTDIDTIRRLNPEIRQWTTPPSQAGYHLRVPAGSGSRFAQAYAALPEDQKRGQSEYRVRRGDSLTKIARRYGTTVTALREVNGIRGSLIRTGQVLYVPVSRQAYASASASSVAHTDTATPVSFASDPAPAQRRTTSAATGTRVTYKVRRGDNLSKIAQKHGVRVSDIKAWNDLSGDRIRSGQRLTIYSGSATASSSSGGKRWVAYHVKRGDNLTKIARRIGATTKEIRTWNDLRSDRLQVGQRLALYTARL